MHNKVALITGASSGIGYAIARRLAPQYLIVLSSRNPENLSRAACKLKAEFPDRDIIEKSMDVTDIEAVDRVTAEVVSQCGNIDVLVNNAGVGGGGVTADFPTTAWQNIININLNGVFNVTHAVLNISRMRENKWGRIVNIASTGGKQGVMYAAAYSASKHGVVGFSKALGLELARSGITVNAVCPGFVETPLAERARANYSRIWQCTVEEAKARIEERVPAGRYINPSEVADLVEFLASSRANGILAQAYNICGGLGNY